LARPELEYPELEYPELEYPELEYPEPQYSVSMVASAACTWASGLRSCIIFSILPPILTLPKRLLGQPSGTR
jgi:hypothetical protein